MQVSAVKNEALDVAAVVAQYQREVEGLKAQLAALTGAVQPWDRPECCRFSVAAGVA